MNYPVTAVSRTSSLAIASLIFGVLSWCVLPVVGAVLGLEGLCLDVQNASPQNGTQIQTTSCNGTGAQVWSLRTDHTFRALGKGLDVGPADDEGGRPGQLQDCTGALSQQWRLLDGKIVNSKSKRCLDIEGNNPADRTPTVIAISSPALTGGGRV